MNINQIKKNNLFPFLFFISVVVIFEAILQFLPLVSDFSYEFSANNGIFFYLIIPFGLRKKISSGARKRTTILVYLATLIFVPIIISLLFGNFQKCSILHGLKYYFVIPFFSAIYSLILIFSLRDFHTKKFYLIYLSILILIVLEPFIEVYLFPHIFFYNILIGYFPGTIYDKFIPVDLKLVLYRLFILLPFLIFAKIKKPSLLKIITILLIFMFPLKIAFGFSFPYSSLENKSKSQISDKNFTLYLFEKADSNKLKYLLTEHNFYKQQIEKFVNQKFNFPVKSFIFPDNDLKRKFFGAPGADVAKPWQHSIFTVSRDNNLKHELAHIYASNFSENVLHIASGFNPALTEGFAVAAQNNFYGFPIYEIASQLAKKKITVPIPELFRNFSFFGLPPSLVYLYSGAFVKYLIEKYGIDKFKKYYATGDFHSTYGIKINFISEDFYTFLNNYDAPNYTSKIVDFILEARQIYQMKCPHYVAEMERKAEHSKDSIASKIYKSLYENYNSNNDFFRYLDILSKNQKFSEALNYIEQNSSKFKHSGYRLKFIDYKIKFLLLTNQTKNAPELIDSLRNSSPFLFYKVKADYYNFILTNSKLATALLLNKGKDEIKNILKRNFSPAVLILNLNLFTQDEIFQFTEKNLGKSWYLNYYLAKYYLQKLDVKKSILFAENLEENHPEQFEFQVRNLLEEVRFFSNHN